MSVACQALYQAILLWLALASTTWHRVCNTLVTCNTSQSGLLTVLADAAQVFRDVPTEQELFADEAGPTTPLIKRGTNLPEEDEGFGNTLRALFSAGPSSGLQRQRCDC